MIVMLHRIWTPCASLLCFIALYLVLYTALYEKQFITWLVLVHKHLTMTPFHRKLTEALSPAVLNIVNDSAAHAGHSGNPGGGPDAETHFR